VSGGSYRWWVSWEWPPRHRDEWSLESLALRFVVSAIGILLADQWVRGIRVGDWQALLVTTAIFAIVHTFVRPLLFWVTCPLQVLTLGLFTLLLNAAMLALTAWAAGQLEVNFSVDGFWAAFLGALLISVTGLVLTSLARRRQAPP
jgi:putative membrane protein